MTNDGKDSVVSSCEEFLEVPIIHDQRGNGAVEECDFLVKVELVRSGVAFSWKEPLFCENGLLHPVKTDRKRKIINRAEKIYFIVVLLAYAINISSSHTAPCGVWCFGCRTARRGLLRNGGIRQGG